MDAILMQTQQSERRKEPKEDAHRSLIKVQMLGQHHACRWLLVESGENAGIIGDDDRSLVGSRKEEIPDPSIVFGGNFVSCHVSSGLGRLALWKGARSPVQQTPW